MILLEKLKEQGWYLTEDGLKSLTTINNSKTEDVNKIISSALDWDLKDIAGGALPSKLESNATISGRIVLQIQKMRNISAPKANEESTAAPRFLQLELSDGVTTIAALEFERIANLNLSMPPGTKLYIKTEKLKLINGFLVLKAADIQVLGGKVEALVEKWQMLKYARSNRRLSGAGGPPPWIAFGKRLDTSKDALPTDRNFKSLQAANEKDKNSKENEEFNASRSQAIAEAAKAGQKKIFGGGQQNILDHNVKKILEKGYSEEEAKQALKATNNNLERALYNLKRRNYARSGSTDNSTKPAATSTGSRARDRVGITSTKEEAVASKPQTNVSLFDFLTDKLPVTVSTSTTIQLQAVSSGNNERITKDNSFIKTNITKAGTVGGNRFENNMSSSFAANRATATPRSDDKQSTQSRSSTTFNRSKEERNQQFGNKIVKSGERNNSNRNQNLTSNCNKTQNQISSTNEDNTNSRNEIKRNERSFKKEKEQINKHLIGDFQANKRMEYNKTPDKKSYQPRENNRNNNQDPKNNNYQQKQIQKSNNFETDLDNLVESTSKLVIQNKKEPSSNLQQSRGRNNQQNSRSNSHQHIAAAGQQNQKITSENNSQHQPSSQFVDSQNCSSKPFQKNTKSISYGPQVGNGFAYDPSKIIGFQNKEANEYAMNLLKSQGLSKHQLHHQQTSSPQTQQAATLAQSPPQQQHQILNNQAPAVAYMTQNPNIFVAPPQQTPPQFGMMSGGNWPWKIGDLCLAKYWDDGNYYDAKITAISEKTCVVLFLGYGNHEEVLKTDCLPITDAQHIPLNAYQANITAPPMSQPPPPAFQQRSNMHSGVGGVGVGNQRYRGERQMYVPPPRRNNN